VSALPTRTQDPMVPAWNSWKAKFEKVYLNDVEEAVRFTVFKQNAEFVMEHNLRESLALESFTVSLNEFADLTSEEFAAQRLSTWVPGYESEHEHTGLGSSPPATQDWVPLGWVTPVKDQGQCGSCWSFSATGSLEGQYFNSTGQKTLVSFSEQQQVSCNNWCFGCNGGNADFAFHYWTKKVGANTEADYPYTSGEGVSGKCETAGKPVITMVAYHVDVTSGSESALESAVGVVGPTSVAIDASQLSFQLYTKGIYSSSKCSTTSLDHAVLTVGYNQLSTGEQYWIVKNSWGTSWGQAGYIWMEKGVNMCGIATDASYPIV
jgi:cathepsin L